jgi:hypothetical protein
MASSWSRRTLCSRLLPHWPRLGADCVKPKGGYDCGDRRQVHLHTEHDGVNNDAIVQVFARFVDKVVDTYLLRQTRRA